MKEEGKEIIKEGKKNQQNLEKWKKEKVNKDERKKRWTKVKEKMLSEDFSRKQVKIRNKMFKKN